jgi:PIN domain nuclease of toxin-antitoxin system
VKLLLDTCAVLWLASGDANLSARVRALLASRDTEAWVSAASAWEIAIKYRRGKLSLPTAVDRFLPVVRDRYQLASLAIDEESALHVAKLPPLHADPFDRMLVSQSIVHGLTIATPDPLVTQYPARTIW